ncbi:MAG: hypothetical protein RI945_350, partial [Candidatus Parcubacteria bacterium]
MDTNKNNIKKHSGFRLLLPIIILLLVVVGSFVYQGFFATPSMDINSNSNAYIN